MSQGTACSVLALTHTDSHSLYDSFQLHIVNLPKGAYLIELWESIRADGRGGQGIMQRLH